MGTGTPVPWGKKAEREKKYLRTTSLCETFVWNMVWIAAKRIWGGSAIVSGDQEECILGPWRKFWEGGLGYSPSMQMWGGGPLRFLPLVDTGMPLYPWYPIAPHQAAWHELSARGANNLRSFWSTQFWVSIRQVHTALTQIRGVGFLIRNQTNLVVNCFLNDLRIFMVCYGYFEIQSNHDSWVVHFQPTVEKWIVLKIEASGKNRAKNNRTDCWGFFNENYVREW